MAATTTGPDFVSFQVRDRAVSAEFYDKLVGLTRLPDSNPAATVFSAGGTAFAVRDPFPGVDLDAIPQLGAGIGVWFHNDDAEGVQARLVDAGRPSEQAPVEGPVGRQVSGRDPDGDVVPIHARA